MGCSTLAMCEVAEIGSVLDFPDQGFSPVSAFCQLPPVEIYHLAITRLKLLLTALWEEISIHTIFLLLEISMNFSNFKT